MPISVHPSECATVGSPVVVVFGPPLPGRAALARALEHRLPGARRFYAPEGKVPPEPISEAMGSGELPIVEGNFRTAHERLEARAFLEQAGARPVFVAWLCDANEAKREVYRRYAGMPTRYADHLWARWEEDMASRQPLGHEIPPAALVGVGARGSILDHVVRVAAALGLPEVLPERRPPPRRVLVVDDDPDELELMAEVLESNACRVFRASSAEEALAVAGSESLDLVISDQQMPGAKGTDLAAELSRHRPDIRVALVTGYAEETVDMAVNAPGVSVLLAKPFKGSDLIRLIDELADRPVTV
ncbi:MAG: response regulator [Deltaproteobacteria bacterium]|nr:response regulator [Deltaproteobacteria bacterium]